MLTETARPIPGRDNEGFVDVALLRARAKEDTREEFTEAFCVPALITASVESDGTSVGEAPAPRTEKGILSKKNTVLASALVDPRPASRYYKRIAFLSKRPGNHFPSMISLGRGMNNDVVFMLETVSKFHGYFIHRGDGWTFTDQRSVNGTLLNGRRLELCVTHALADGDRLTFGADLETRFVLPESLRTWLVDTCP